MTPSAWHNSIAGDTVFEETYELTRFQILEFAKRGGHDAIIEAGCGTGDVIGELKTTIPRYGLDINDKFIDYCKAKYQGESNMTFVELDVLRMSKWFSQFQGKYKKPLVLCVNSALNIMPEELGGKVVLEMLNITGPQGQCVVSYWNGNFFSHAVMNYKANADLCGSFDLSHVDWDKRILSTPTGYTTHWMLPEEVQRLLRSYDVNIDAMASKMMPSKHHINTEGLSIFAWFSLDCTSRNLLLPTFGEIETIHIGRYDLLTNEEAQMLSNSEQILRAEELQEEEFVKLFASKFQGDAGLSQVPKMRILDMGGGYGGFLRRLWKEGLVWNAVGCDIAHRMCDHNCRLNQDIGADKDITILEESYLSVSVPDESMDLVISMDALLHIGPDGHHMVAKEAARVLRPGGWMIFSDIMEHDVVDATEMKPIYDRIHLSKLGTVTNYKKVLQDAGFSRFAFQPHSSNVSCHYGTVKKVLMEKKDTHNVSQDFCKRMTAGLEVWEELAPKNIQWGFVMAQKTNKVDV